MLDRTYVKEAKENLGTKVTLAGWVTRIRDLKNFIFIIFRDCTGEIQITLKKDGSIEGLEDLSLGREDVIKVEGQAVESKVVKAGVEFIPDNIEVLNKAQQPLPFDLFGSVRAEMDTRLNHRFMDFRTPKTNAIFKIQNTLLTAFRKFLTDRGYLEFQPPCIIASASEGGADLFRLPYFEKEAFLAQSPQLYKQMTAISFEKVYTITPIWRAEKFNTPTHLNEIRQMDIEQAFADDKMVMNVLEEIFVYMLQEVKENCSHELELLNREIIIPKLPLKRITYTKAVEMLQEVGEEIVWGPIAKAFNIMCKIIGIESFFHQLLSKELRQVDPHSTATNLNTVIDEIKSVNYIWVFLRGHRIECFLNARPVFHEKCFFPH